MSQSLRTSNRYQAGVYGPGLLQGKPWEEAQQAIKRRLFDAFGSEIEMTNHEYKAAYFPFGDNEKRVGIYEPPVFYIKKVHDSDGTYATIRFNFDPLKYYVVNIYNRFNDLIETVNITSNRLDSLIEYIRTKVYDKYLHAADFKLQYQDDSLQDSQWPEKYQRLKRNLVQNLPGVQMICYKHHTSNKTSTRDETEPTFIICKNEPYTDYIELKCPSTNIFQIRLKSPSGTFLKSPKQFHITDITEIILQCQEWLYPL